MELKGTDVKATGPEAPARPPAMAIAGVLVVLFLSAIDATIVNTAMPAVVAAIGGMELYPWIFSGFMLASTVVMPFYGKFADLYGVRRCLYVAIAVFLLGSAACGAATTMGVLVAARVVQGLGAGGIGTLTFVSFGQLFPPEARGRAQGLVASIWGVSALLGPLAGGLIVTYVSWPWVFWINLPAGLVAVAFIVKAYPGGHPTGGARRISWLDGLLLVLGLTAVMAALSGPGSVPAGMPPLPVGLGGVALLAWFLARQATAAEPLVPLAPFRNRVFGASAALGVGSSLTMFAALTYVPLLVQGAWGLSAPEAGAAITPMMVAWPAAGAVAGLLVNRLGFRTQVVAGAAMMLVGYLLLWRPPGPHTVYVVAATSALLGAGMGLITSTTLVAAQVAVPRRMLGTASATLTLVRNVAAAVGVLAMGVVQLRGFEAALAARGMALGPDQIAALVQPGVGGHGVAAVPAGLVEPARVALEASIRGVFGASVGLAVLTLAVAFLLPPWSPAEAARRAEEAE